MISLPASLERLAPPPGPRIEAERCVRRRLPEASCRRCAEACPRGAINLGRQPAIDPALCTGCLLCAAACPMEALSPSGMGLTALLPHLATLPAPVLGCLLPGVQAHARLGCLGLLTSPVALVLLTLRLPRGVTLNLSSCPGCRNEQATHRLNRILDTVAELLPAEFADRVKTAENPGDLRFEEEGLSRRGFFKRLRKKSRETASGLLQRVDPTTRATEGAKTPPSLRTLLPAALTPLEEEFRRTLEDLLFPYRTNPARCRGCAGCVGLCPTGALRLDGGPGQAPSHHRKQCSGCGLCRDFCRHGPPRLAFFSPAISPRT